jgi:putative transposase
MTSVFALTAAVFGSFFRGKRELVLENLALRQQLAVYKRVQKRPRLRPTDRAFWAWLSRLWDGWKTPLILVSPETVIRWHRQGFKLYWRWRSRAKRPARLPFGGLKRNCRSVATVLKHEHSWMHGGAPARA